MKKYKKKRIVRRKRRISEREIMRIKRKLKKSARKLRLGAKRTGAYVYGTLRRIVGNPAIPAHMGNPEFVREFRIGEMRARVSGEPVGLYAYRTKGGWGFITRKQSMYRPPGEELVVLFGEKRGLRGNPYPTGGMTPLERLRYHVSGAIARGEATPIVGKPRRRIVRVLGYDVVEGSKKHMRLLAQKRHFDDLQKSERGLRGNPRVTIQDIYRIIEKIESEGGRITLTPAGSGGLNLYVDRISPYDGKTIEKGHEYLLRGTKKDIYEALIKIRFVPMYHPYARKLQGNPKTRASRPYRHGHLGYAYSQQYEQEHLTKARPIPGRFYRVYFSDPQRGETTALIFKGEQLLKLSISDLSRYWPMREGLKMTKAHFRGPYDSWNEAFMDK